MNPIHRIFKYLDAATPLSIDFAVKDNPPKASLGQEVMLPVRGVSPQGTPAVIGLRTKAKWTSRDDKRRLDLAQGDSH